MSWIEVILRAIEVIFVAAGFAVLGYAGKLRIEAQRAEATAEAKEKLIDVLSNSSDAWKSRYEAEHGEILEYRKKVHEKNERDGAELLRLTGENERLKNLTDLTPVIAFQKDQALVNKKIVETLDTLVKHVEKLAAPPEPPPPPEKKHRRRALTKRRSTK